MAINLLIYKVCQFLEPGYPGAGALTAVLSIKKKKRNKVLHLKHDVDDLSVFET